MSSSRSMPQNTAMAQQDAALTPNQDELYGQAVEQFGPSVARLAAAYEANRTHREDLLQEIHLALWRSFATFNNHCSLRTWVYRVANNTAATHVLRHKRARLSQLVSLEDLPAIPDDFDSAQQLDESAVLDRLGVLIRRLKSIDRDVLIMYLEGMEAADIADVVGISKSNVAQRVHRTKKLLQGYFLAGGDHGHSQ
jgi:RNA polymerase sigma-70 factor (ECF subfamily)